MAGPELLVVGVVSIAAGVLYTGGPRPYGYEGLGELFVFLFFGLVAVAGSYYVQTEELTWESLALAVPVGLLAAAILVVNNVRDLDTDRRAGKRTLAVRLGRERARSLFVAMLAVAYARAGGDPGAGRALMVGCCCRWRRWCWCRRCVRDGAHAHRRPCPERRAGRHRAAAGRVLAAALGGDPAVVRRSLLRLQIPLQEPFVTAGGVVAARELAVIRLEDDEGTVGFGEAAPLEPYDGVSVDEVVEALREGPPARGAPAAGARGLGAGGAGPADAAAGAPAGGARAPTRSP